MLSSCGKCAAKLKEAFVFVLYFRFICLMSGRGCEGGGMHFFVVGEVL